MSAEVYRHDLVERRTTTLVLSVGLAVLAASLLSVSAGLGDTITQITEDMPEALTAFIGGEAPGGYVVAELFELIAPLALVAFAVTGGAATLAGEESRGTMALLAAQPVSRTRVLLGKAASLLTSLASAGALLFVAVTVSAVAFGIELEAGAVAAACLHLVALAALFGGVALAVGSATGRQDLAVAVAGALALTSYLGSAMLPLAGLDGWAELSPWSWYAGGEVLATGVDTAGLAGLAGLTAVAVAAAFLTYPRRDLRG